MPSLTRPRYVFPTREPVGVPFYPSTHASFQEEIDIQNAERITRCTSGNHWAVTGGPNGLMFYRDYYSDATPEQAKVNFLRDLNSERSGYIKRINTYLDNIKKTETVVAEIKAIEPPNENTKTDENGRIINENTNRRNR